MWRRIIGAALLIALALWGLVGCSAIQLGYGQGPLLVGWWLDDHLDFTPTHKRQVGQHLDAWFAWHRRTQLTDYATLAARAAGELRQPSVSASQACTWADVLQTRAWSSVQQALPAMASVARTLEPAELLHLERKLADKNREFRQQVIEARPERRQRERLKTWRKRYEDLYDDLNPAQEALLTEAAARWGADPLLREAEHLAHQRELLALLRRLSGVAGASAAASSAASGANLASAAHATNGAGPADAARAAQAELEAYWRASLTVGGWGSPTWRAWQVQARQAHCELFARMHQQASPAQREHAARWLLGWEQTLRELAAAAPASGT